VQHPPRPLELGGEDGQAGEDDEPARARVRDGDDAEHEDGEADHGDRDAPRQAQGAPLLQAGTEALLRRQFLGHRGLGVAAPVAHTSRPSAITLDGAAGAVRPRSSETAYAVNPSLSAPDPTDLIFASGAFTSNVPNGTGVPCAPTPHRTYV
jgi:hypothetical protein